jgi:hypothetical protein
MTCTDAGSSSIGLVCPSIVKLQRHLAAPERHAVGREDDERGRDDLFRVLPAPFGRRPGSALDCRWCDEDPHGDGWREHYLKRAGELDVEFAGSGAACNGHTVFASDADLQCLAEQRVDEGVGHSVASVDTVRIDPAAEARKPQSASEWRLVALAVECR